MGLGADDCHCPVWHPRWVDHAIGFGILNDLRVPRCGRKGKRRRTRGWLNRDEDQKSDRDDLGVDRLAGISCAGMLVAFGTTVRKRPSALGWRHGSGLLCCSPAGESVVFHIADHAHHDQPPRVAASRKKHRRHRLHGCRCVVGSPVRSSSCVEPVHHPPYSHANGVSGPVACTSIGKDM